MTIDVSVPVLPESVTDATLLTWHKKPGENVQRGENLVDLETDKVVLEVPAPSDGALSELLKQDGDTVTAGDILARIDEQQVAQQSAPEQAPETSAIASSTGVETITPDAISLSPAVRRLVAEHQLDPGHIQGTGKDGRLTKTDVQNYLQKRKREEIVKDKQTSLTITAEQTAPPPPILDDEAITALPTTGRPEQRVPMTCHCRTRCPNPVGSPIRRLRQWGSGGD